MKLKFQHCKVDVNDITLRYVDLYKHELLKRISQVLDKYQVKYILSCGNLLEYVRGEKIFQDDDIDIRTDLKDFKNWMIYCYTLRKRGNSYYDDTQGLIYDFRAKLPKKQLLNGIQATLNINKLNINKLTTISPPNLKTLQTCPNKEIDVHMDIVPCRVTQPNFWNDECLGFSKPLRKVEYLGIPNISIPTKQLSDILLKKRYGPNYLIPYLKSKRLSDGTYIQLNHIPKKEAISPNKKSGGKERFINKDRDRDEKLKGKMSNNTTLRCRILSIIFVVLVIIVIYVAISKGWLRERKTIRK